MRASRNSPISSTEPASELLQRQAMRPGVIGIDQVANGFSLGEVALSMKKGPLCELTRQCGLHPRIDETLHEALNNERASMNVTFHHILSRESSLGPLNGRMRASSSKVSPS